MNRMMEKKNRYGEEIIKCVRESLLEAAGVRIGACWLESVTEDHRGAIEV